MGAITRKITLILLIMLFIIVNARAQSGVFSGLTGCYVTNNSGCQAGDTRLFNISDNFNAHTGNRYLNAVCCTDINTAVTNSCSATNKDILFNVSNVDDGHVALLNDGLAYANPICLGTSDGSPVDCNYAFNNTACSQGYHCVVKVSDFSNGGRHVGSCGNSSMYSTKICCAAGLGFTTTSISYNQTTIPAVSSPGICGDGRVNFGEQCDSNTPTDVGCQIFGGTDVNGQPLLNSCDVKGLKTGLPCTCYSSDSNGLDEIVIFQSSCQDNGDGDDQGLRQVTTKTFSNGVSTEVNEQKICTIPPVIVPFFSFANVLIVISILSLYYTIKKIKKK